MGNQTIEQLVRVWAAAKRDYEKKKAFLDSGLYRYDQTTKHKKAADEAKVVLADCEAKLLAWAE